MSQLKDFSHISQKQILNELKAYSQTPEVQDFLKDHPAILVALIEFISEIEGEFPDCKVELKTAETTGSEKLQIYLFAPVRKPQALEKFSKFKKGFVTGRFNSLQNLVILNIKFPDSEGEDTWDELDELIGAIEGPEDWAAEHDHYLYGTPKLNQ